MNGFADHGVDEAAFEEKKGLREGLRTFDAFPKTKATYTTRDARGGQWTVILIAVCMLLSLSELRSYWRGHEEHQFSVEKGVGHEMQINLDVVVGMHCSDLHVNVQDASGDRIMAGQVLRKDPTSFEQWERVKNLRSLSDTSGKTHEEELAEDHVSDVMGHVQRGKAKFKKTPRVKGDANSCRVFGSMDLNKVQADFHITARGYGYSDLGQHVDQKTFNFSHIINELSFGPLYPSLKNPLDQTLQMTFGNLMKYQYFLSVVPTVYNSLSYAVGSNSKTVRTNQYAVTERSYELTRSNIPGIFWKFDIEPILLTVTEERKSFLSFVIRLVNIISGILVAGGWSYQIWELLFGSESGALWRIGRRARAKSDGVLNGRVHDEHES